MKSFVLPVIVLVVAGLILAFFTPFFGRQKADLRYTLSERIPSNFVTDTSGENIQQLIIKNNGELKAENIRIKIDLRLIEYKLIKYSLADSVRIFSGGSPFELIYPYLPPQGSLKLILRSHGEGIKNSDVDIRHDGGLGTEALEETRNTSTETVSGVLIMFYLMLVSFGIRTMAIDSFDSDVRYRPYDKILKRNKPWYMTHVKWNDIRTKSMENVFSSRWSASESLEKSSSYAFLNSEKIEELSSDEWKSLLNYAVDAFRGAVSTLLNEAYFAKNIVSLLSLTKPKYFLQTEWDTVKARISKRYMALLAEEINTSRFAPAKLITALKRNQPDGVLDEHWREYCKYVRQMYFNYLVREVHHTIDPIKFIAEMDTTVLEAEDMEVVEKRSYDVAIQKIIQSLSLFAESKKIATTGLPAWMNDDDRHNVQAIAAATVESENGARKYRFLVDGIMGMLDGDPIGEHKPDTVTDDEWRKVKSIEANFVTRGDAIESEAVRAEQLVAATEGLKEKILKQLDVIDNLFKDPESIFKLEEYNVPFAPGNYEVLKRLAQQLKRT